MQVLLLVVFRLVLFTIYLTLHVFILNFFFSLFPLDLLVVEGLITVKSADEQINLFKLFNTEALANGVDLDLELFLEIFVLFAIFESLVVNQVLSFVDQ